MKLIKFLILVSIPFLAGPGLALVLWKANTPSAPAETLGIDVPVSVSPSGPIVVTNEFSDLIPVRDEVIDFRPRAPRIPLREIREREFQTEMIQEMREMNRIAQQAIVDRRTEVKPYRVAPLQIEPPLHTWYDWQAIQSLQNLEYEMRVESIRRDFGR